jgi:hypothetical protein
MHSHQPCVTWTCHVSLTHSLTHSLARRPIRSRWWPQAKVNSGGGAASWLYNKLLKAFSETLSTTVEHEMQLAIEAALIDIQVTHPRILTHFHASSRTFTHPHASSRTLMHPHCRLRQQISPYEQCY